PTFFAEQRLGALSERLSETNRLHAQRARNLERVILRLPELLPHDPPPSLLHGDLWAGNWLPLADGRAALIDPAIYFGDREADLAMTRLFGGFPPAFYQAYKAAWPLDPGADERVPLYNLYHLLNHLLLFGESYGTSVDRVLEQFV
ncbi:MAG: fructosamine kinase family protein, partial [Chloroflexota bacterium]|nr:fructosamine kinase family protein [Chloroflexota bacterium]